MAAERRGNVSPHCCGCSTRVMYENLPPDHTAVQPATTTAASTVRSAPAGSAREEEVDQSRATSGGGGADDGQRRRRHRTPKGPGPVSAVRSAPTHSKLGRRVTRDTTPGCIGPSATRHSWLWRWSSSRVLRAPSDSIPCRDYSMGRLVPLAGKGVTPTNTVSHVGRPTCVSGPDGV